MLSLDIDSIIINNSYLKGPTSMSSIEKITDGCLIRKMKNSQIGWLLPPSEEYLLCSKCDSLTTQGSLVATEVLPKVWIQKFQNTHIPPDYANDIDEGLFCFNKYRN